MKKAVSGIMLTLLILPFMAMITLAFSLRSATASLPVQNTETNENFAGIQEERPQTGRRDVEDGYTIHKSPNGQDTNDCNHDLYTYPDGNLLDETSTEYNNDYGAHIIEVPHCFQVKSYYCVVACLEMIFDYWGPDISQYEIANAAWTNSSWGTVFPSAFIRAAHFSNMSNSMGKDEPLHNVTGYTGRDLGYAGFWGSGGTLEDLKNQLDADYPIAVYVKPAHVVNVVGYDDSSQEVIIHDPAQGAYLRYNYSYFMDNMWNGYAAFAAPWKVTMSVPSNITTHTVFQVNATIEYTAPLTSPVWSSSLNSFPALFSNATIILPEGVSLHPDENKTKPLLNGTFNPKDITTISWRLVALEDHSRISSIAVIAQGLVSWWEGWGAGAVKHYYTDRIGGLENKTYGANDVPLTVTVIESTSWIGYSLDGQTNVTVTGNTTLMSLLDGAHYLVSLEASLIPSIKERTRNGMCRKELCMRAR